MDSLQQSGFVWDEELGIGYFPVDSPFKYDQAYWDKYVSYRNNAIGRRLMETRLELVQKYYKSGSLVDIGIGSGYFIETRGPDTYGYDVNPVAVRWLLDRNLWWDPYARDPVAVSCWDSLEHMKRPEAFLRQVSGFVFISIPIFLGKQHALCSKHFKPDEHFWYFTEHGFVAWMRRAGFEMIETNHMECDLGREDIGTFVFKRMITIPPG